MHVRGVRGPDTGSTGNSGRGGVPIYRFALHPVFLVSFVVMVLNDAFLRPSGVWPLFTGKVSDVAVLIFLPAVGALAVVYVKYCIHLVAAGFFHTGIAYALTRWTALFSIAVTALVFTLINISPSCNALYVKMINAVNVLAPVYPELGSTMDATDLITLPALYLSYVIMRKYFQVT